ncbi:MAG: ferritin-like domain-containing protein [Fermentimonas sp.]|nr:ferritin-like domain-containing protein [Fermentimonas sp.]
MDSKNKQQNDQKKSTKSNGNSKSQSNQTKSTSSTKKQKQARFGEEHEGKLLEFFVEEVKDIYFAEHEALKALKKMEKAATSKALKDSIVQHHGETEEQIKRLEQVFELLGEKPSKKKCEGILGIIKDGESVIEDTDDNTMVRDAAIIIASQKIEHYEITSYGSLAELARTLGKDDLAELLEVTLEEEKQTDVTLTILAEESINEDASNE